MYCAFRHVLARRHAACGCARGVHASAGASLVAVTIEKMLLCTLCFTCELPHLLRGRPMPPGICTYTQLCELPHIQRGHLYNDSVCHLRTISSEGEYYLERGSENNLPNCCVAETASSSSRTWKIKLEVQSAPAHQLLIVASCNVSWTRSPYTMSFFPGVGDLCYLEICTCALYTGSSVSLMIS